MTIDCNEAFKLLGSDCDDTHSVFVLGRGGQLDKGRHTAISEPGYTFNQLLVLIDVVVARGHRLSEIWNHEGFIEMHSSVFGSGKHVASFLSRTQFARFSQNRAGVAPGQGAAAFFAPYRTTEASGCFAPGGYSGSMIGEFGGSAASDEAKSQAGLRAMLYMYIMIVAVVRFFSI
ncbi:MAG: hypothetical protein KK476_00870 [Sinorhizobium fredii]|nr:hypothetical protein AOX55_00006160 [Sinorhizobium fredii CCBAU 25509]MCG5473417.1 hypothetical protein [Sinorhizobium fredii]